MMSLGWRYPCTKGCFCDVILVGYDKQGVRKERLKDISRVSLPTWKALNIRPVAVVS